MKPPVIISLFQAHPLLEPLAKKMGFDVGNLILKNYPDNETYIRFETNVQNRDLIILNSLDRPNDKIVPLLLTAETARDLGAASVGLIAPYLAYMRQDKRFQAGEGITSIYFASLLSQYFDWLVTVDPHLHRHHTLNEIYSIPTTVLHASSPIVKWIKKHVERPILIGPDIESEQWVKDIALKANAPYLILKKTRHGDRAVDISKPAIEPFINHTPVLIDDIISTAQTMIVTIHHLKQLKMKPPVCVGVHAVFSDNAYDELHNTGVGQIITSNSIPHPSNQIDLSSLLIPGIDRAMNIGLNKA